MKRAAIGLCLALVGCIRMLHAGELLPYSGPDERLSLVLEDLSGRQQALNERQGKVVLVNFWASWCAPCLIEMPGMQRLLTAMQDRPFDILAVNVNEARDKVWRFKTMLGIDFTTLLDSDGVVAQAWDVQVYPTSYLIDPDGHIRYVAYGALTWDDMQTRQQIEALMPDRKPAVRPVPVP